MLDYPETPIDVPEDYHKFAKVFSEGKADTLPPHCASGDLKIELENRSPPPTGHMYSLSGTEVDAL